MADMFELILNPGWLQAQNQYNAAIYGHNTNANIAYLQALAQLQQQQLANSGSVDVERLRGQNQLGVVNTQGQYDLLRQELVNSGQMSLQQAKATSDAELQRMAINGQIDVTRLQGRNALDLAGVNNAAQLQQIMAQTGAQRDIAGMNNQTALQQAMIQLQGQLAPVASQERRSNQVLGMISPLLAQMFGIDPSTLAPTAGQQQGGDTLQGASREQLEAALRVRQKQALPTPQNPQEWIDREAYVDPWGMRGNTVAREGGELTTQMLRQGVGNPYRNQWSNPGSQLPPGHPAAASATAAPDPYKNLRNAFPQLAGVPTTGYTSPQAMTPQQRQEAAKRYGNTVVSSNRPPQGASGGAGTGTNTGGPGNTGNNGVPGGVTNPTGARAGARPMINTSPLYDQRAMAQIGNRAEGNAYRAAASANKAAATRMGQAGFSAGSPALQAMQNKNAMMASAQGTDSRFNAVNQARVANAQHVLDAQKADADVWNNAGMLDWRYFDSQTGSRSSLLNALLGGLF